MSPAARGSSVRPRESRPWRSVNQRVFGVNTKIPVFISQKAWPRLRDGGRIINISTGATRSANPSLAAYAMSKGALNILTLELAKQLGPRGITANTLAPGFVETDMSARFLSDPQVRQAASSRSALGRVGQPADIADVAAFLASHDGRWVTGHSIDATGGVAALTSLRCKSRRTRETADGARPQDREGQVTAEAGVDRSGDGGSPVRRRMIR